MAPEEAFVRRSLPSNAASALVQGHRVCTMEWGMSGVPETVMLIVDRGKTLQVVGDGNIADRSSSGSGVVDPP